MQKISKRLSMWAAGIVALLMIPLIGTLLGSGIEGEGVYWTPFDFIFMSVLLFGAALTYELLVTRIESGTYRIAVGIAVVTAVALVWINGAVGIIGSEDNPANLMYFGVLATGFIGAVISRLQPQKMAWTLFVMAVLQMLVPTIALIIALPQLTAEPPGIVRVFFLNAFFAMAWTTSGLLFRQAAEGGQQQVQGVK